MSWFLVLSLNEVVGTGTFTHFTENKAFYFTYANRVQIPAEL